ncbi:MAG: hypothetical protein MJ189_05255, partial [Coriobacteriales bacterium]|nr:hypothetical protein [Coriobacteriales bacterium]
MFTNLLIAFFTSICNNLIAALLISLVIIALAVVWVLWYKNQYTRKKSRPKKVNNAGHRVVRTMVYCTSFGLILGSVLADIVAIKVFYADG